MLKASLKYTKPTSALPEAVHANTSLTSLAKTSLSLKLSFIAREVKVSSAYLPAGTLAGSPRAILDTISEVKLSIEVISLLLFEISTKEFFTKSLLVSSKSNPSSAKAVICFSPAEINKSQGAPCSICC